MSDVLLLARLLAAVEALRTSAQPVAEGVLLPAGAWAEVTGAFDAAMALRPCEDTPEQVSLAVHVWVDGSGTTSEGLAGCGVYVVLPDGSTLERGYFLGTGTNNFAEVSAILKALRVLRDELKVPPTTKVVMHSDSQWAIGSVTQDWDIKSNVAQVLEARSLLKTMGHVRLQHVKGHAGIAGNEAADALAGAAVVLRGTVVSVEAARALRKEYKAARRAQKA